MSAAAFWASQGTSVALEMVVPPVIGLWADQKLGTQFLFVIVGAIVGFAAGMLSLLQMVHTYQQRKEKEQDKNDDRPPSEVE